jgi:hypothetical protein
MSRSAHRLETREGDIPMTAGQSTRPVSNVSLAPAPLAALLAATLLGGAMIGAGITLQLGSTDAGTATIGTAAHPAAFDAPAFRAEEHRSLAGTSDSGPLSSEHRDRIGGP